MKQTWIISIIWPVTAICNIVLNILLIPSYGKYGASVATLASFLLILIAYFIAVHKVYSVDFQYKKFIRLILITAIFFFFSTFVRFGITLSIGLKALIFITYLGGVYFSGYYSAMEIAVAKNFRNKLWKYIFPNSNV